MIKSSCERDIFCSSGTTWRTIVEEVIPRGGGPSEQANAPDSEQRIVTQVFFNEGARCSEQSSFGETAEEADAFYSALVAFREIVEFDERLQIEFRLEPNSMVLFNNNRVLHGRRAFVSKVDDEQVLLRGAGAGAVVASSEEGTSERFLRGGYIEWDDVLSSLRAAERERELLVGGGQL